MSDAYDNSSASMGGKGALHIPCGTLASGVFLSTTLRFGTRSGILRSGRRKLAKGNIESEAVAARWNVGGW